MARTFSRNQQTYPAGVYGPFSIDSFTKGDADRMVTTMTVVGWPNVSPLMRVTMSWDTGGAATFDVSGEQRDENGNPMSEVSFSFSIPKVAGQKRDVAGGSITVETFAPITTAITFRAA